MPAQRRPVLGVDINQYEIRVVEMRGVGPSAQVIRAGAVPVPRGAIEGDRIIFPDTISETLRGLLHRMNVSTRQAVVGLGAANTITRVLDLPRVPDHEIRMVIEGELAHYQILRAGTGAFDYLRLQDPPPGKEAAPPVLVMATEERTVDLYREITERAGLQLLALEPILLSMYRTATPLIQAQPSAACLLISYGKSEIAIADQGHIRLYRRVDIGSNDLIAGRQPASSLPLSQGGEAHERVLLGDDAPFESPLLSEGEGEINAVAANNLATELQRSLDYYRREFPQAPAVTRVILATNDPEIDPLAQWLSQALAIDCIVAEPPISMGVSRALAAQLEAPEGLRYLGAAGLALNALPGLPATVPRFDLSAFEREAVEVVAARGRLAVSLAISVSMIVVGLVVTLTFLRHTGILEHQIRMMQSDLMGKQQLEQAQIQEIQLVHDRYVALKREGVPFPRIMDLIARAVSMQAGLTTVGLDRAGRLAVEGEAEDEKAMIDTLNEMSKCPYFTNTTLDSFTNRFLNDQRTRRVVEFKISSQIVGISPPGGPSGTTTQ